MPSLCDLCTVIDPAGSGGSLGQHLRPGQRWIMSRTDTAAVVPTIGAFLRGYLLVVPTTHTTSIGRLPLPQRRGVQQLTDQLAGQLGDVYGLPVLGFEYGLNVPGSRRIEHGHLHLLPTTAGTALRHFLRWHLPLIEIDSMEHLPTSTDHSYISVFEPGRPVAVYPVANDAAPRIRLRELVAQFDPRVSPRRWDWQRHPHPDLIQATIDDLAGTHPDRLLATAGLR